MTTFVPENERRLLPRFRSSAAAGAAGDLCSVTPKVAPPAIIIPTEHFDALQADWNEHPSIEAAVELVCTASVLGRSLEVQQAARYLLDHRNDLEKGIVAIALTSLIGPANAIPGRPTVAPFELLSQTEIRAALSYLKSRLAQNPRNAIAWMDRSHLHTLLGQRDAAERSIRRAIALAPNNRFVLRSASRFFMHEKSKRGIGLDFLRRSRALRTDPWLMSAEIALSTVIGKAPQSLSSARSLLDADTLKPWHTSELNGAVGTFAMIDRSVGKPGQYFRRSLRDATENAVAQAQWFANKHAGVAVPSEKVTNQWSPEAVAIKAREEKNWPDVITACRQWMLMDPASSRPLILGAFVASVALYDGAATLSFTEHWIRIEPNSSGAWNNHAVALAYLGRIPEARASFARVDENDTAVFPKAVYLATKGLLAYRSGDIDAGRKHYLEAAESEDSNRDPTLRALVYWHMLREESHVGTPNARELMERAWSKSKSLPILELEAMKQTVEKSLQPTLGHRLIATFQGDKPPAPMLLDSWK
jgi:Tfp pilus assembly protein PilF